MKLLVKIFQSVFIYNNDETANYEWYLKYDKKNLRNLYGGFLYFHERKEIKFFRYGSRKLGLCNEIQKENIITNLSLIHKKHIYKKNSYGSIEYNKNYRMTQNGLVLKIKRNKDKKGNIFISSSSSEWTSNAAIKFLKNSYNDEWKKINNEKKQELEIKDYFGKTKTNKLKLAVLIELIMRKTDTFIQGDLMWLFNNAKL